MLYSKKLSEVILHTHAPRGEWIIGTTAVALQPELNSELRQAAFVVYDRAARIIQRMFDSRLFRDRCRSSCWLMRGAAIVIQSAWRGFATRKQVTAEWEEEVCVRRLCF